MQTTDTLSPLPYGYGLPVSGVHTPGKEPVDGVPECPAYSQNGECGNCRNCWDKSVPALSYPEH